MNAPAQIFFRVSGGCDADIQFGRNGNHFNARDPGRVDGKRAFLWYAVSVIPAVGFAQGLKLLYDVDR